MAHEFGHWVLHRNARIMAKDRDFRDTRRDLVTGRKVIATPAARAEWQANRFAAAILMPRRTVHTAVAEAQAANGIGRNLGLIYLDDQPHNVRDFKAVRTALSDQYQVSRTVVRLRLADLGVLHDARDRGLSHVSTLFRTTAAAV